MKGTIKKLNKEKGFGFITPESGADVFFHTSVVADGGFDQLQEGDAVVFEAEDAPKGRKATTVSLSMGGAAANDNAMADDMAA